MPKQLIDTGKKTPRPNRKRATRPTIQIKGSKRGDTEEQALVGHEARLQIYVLRALAMKRLNFYHHEIAEEIAKEFNLESVPAITTVADWLKKGRNEVRADIEELSFQMRMEQFKELDRMKRKFLQLACAEELQIKRWAMIEGELQPELDENAVKEQLAAGKLVVTIMARQAKLLGLDLEKSEVSTEEGPKNLLELQLWMIGQVNVISSQSGGEIDVNHKTLEIKSGIPELDTDSI